MIALLCKDGAQEIVDKASGIFDVRVVRKMSALLELRESQELDVIWLDPRLGIEEAIQEKLPGVHVYVYEIPFEISEAMRWDALRRTEMELGDEEQVDDVQSHECELCGAEFISYPIHGKYCSQRCADVDNEEWAATAEQPALPVFTPSRKRNVPVLMLDSPKGGEGRSTIGSHMAYFGAMQGKKVAVIDLDTQGNIAAMLGHLEPIDARGWRGQSVNDAVRAGVCIVHESGLHVFPSPQSSEVVLQSPEDALHVLGICLSEMDVVFLDMPQGWTPLHTTLLPFVTQVIAVVSPKVDRLDRVQEHMEKLAHAGLTEDDVTVIVNQSRGRSDLKGMGQYLSPFKPTLRVPYDDLLLRKGGLNGKKVIKACVSWWHQVYELRRQPTNRLWRWFRK